MFSLWTVGILMICCWCSFIVFLSSLFFIWNLCESSALTCSGLTVVTYICVYKQQYNRAKKNQRKKRRRKKLKVTAMLWFWGISNTTANLSCCRCFLFCFFFVYSFAMAPLFLSHKKNIHLVQLTLVKFEWT